MQKKINDKKIKKEILDDFNEIYMEIYNKNKL